MTATLQHECNLTMKNQHIIVGEPCRCVCGVYNGQPLTCNDVIASLGELVKHANIRGSGVSLYAHDILRIESVIGPLVQDCEPNSRMKNEKHPWAAFLKSRADAIDWLHLELEESDEAIVRTLSMDTTQVWLIRTRDRTVGNENPQLKAKT